MICIDFCVIYKYRVKQLMIFERTVAAASDFKNYTMVNCECLVTPFINPANRVPGAQLGHAPGASLSNICL